MELEKLLLKKEEVPVIDNFFLIPIPPKLLCYDIKIDKEADSVFQRAVEESEIEAKTHVRQFYYEVGYLENGLADFLFLNPHVGMYIQKSGRPLLLPPYVEFSQNKQEEFTHGKEKDEYLLDNGPPFAYMPKNTESGKTDAILLRNWAMLYLNEVMKEIFGR